MDLYQKFNLSQRKIHFQDGKEITLPEEGTVITKEELPSADNIATLSGENTFENMNVFEAGLSTLGVSVGQYGNSGGSIQTTTLGTGELGVAMVSHTGDATVQAKMGANILSQGGTGILLHDSSNGDKALQISSDGIAFTGSGVVVPNATSDTQAPNFSQVKNLTATSNTNGLIKLATDDKINYGGAVGISNSGQARVQLMNDSRAGTAKTGGKGIQVDVNGVLSMLHRVNYSGFEYEGNNSFINAAEQTIHPTAGTAGKVAFDTAGKLVVLNASSTVPGTVLIGANENATGNYTVLSASSIKTYVGNTISTLKSGANSWTGNNTFTGVLTVSNDPVSLTDAANKKYVDAAVLAGTAWQGGLDVSGATTKLTINSEVRKGFFWRISAGTITVNNVDYTVGDLIVANANFGAGAEKPISSFSFFNGQDTDVVKLTETQTLTNKTLTSANLSATSNTYRDATNSVSGAVMIADGVVEDSTKVVTSGLLYDTLAPLNTFKDETVPNTYAKLEGGNEFTGTQTITEVESDTVTNLSESTAVNLKLVKRSFTSEGSDSYLDYSSTLSNDGLIFGTVGHGGAVPPLGTRYSSYGRTEAWIPKLSLGNNTIDFYQGMSAHPVTFVVGTYNVVGDTLTQVLTNKNISDNSNTYRAATSTVSGAVTLATAMTDGSNAVVTSDLLHSVITPINEAIGTTIPNTYAKLEGGNEFEDSQSFELGQGNYVTASFTYNEPLAVYDNEIRLKESRRSDSGAQQMLSLNPGGIHIGYNPDGPVGPTSNEPTSLVQGLLTVDKVNLINQKIISTSSMGVNYMTATLPSGTYNVVGDTLTQVLTNKNISDSTNTYRDATSTVSGAVTLATAMTDGSNAVVTSDLLHSIITPINETIEGITGLPKWISGTATYGATASGTTSLAIGNSASASGANSTALGGSANAAGNYSTALGLSAIALKTSSTALGHGASASENYTTTLGYLAKASGTNSTTLGCQAEASGYYATALGGDATASSSSSTAVGYNATASGSSSTALGGDVSASGLCSTAVGNHTSVSGNSSIALGSYTSAHKDYSIALGDYTSAYGSYSIAMGGSSIAMGDYATTLGCQANASGTNSTALGSQTTAFGTNSTALGYLASANGSHSTALGDYSTTHGSYSTAVGYNATASLPYSTVIAATNPVNSTLLRLMMVSDTDENSSYFVFQSEDTLSGTAVGVKISAANFFAMLKAAGGEDYTTTSGGGGSGYYSGSY